MKKYLKLMRVHHYIKNILILLPLACSGQLFSGQLLVKAVLGFFAFAFASSAVYIINDSRDIERDKLHPTKCKRPLANGSISVKNAMILMAGLAVAAAVLSIIIGSWTAALWLIVYVGLNIGYSCGWKNVPILDVTILVMGYVIRVLYGASVTGIEISSWLYLTIFAISFYFALGKRRNELRQTAGEMREVLKFYSDSFLNMNMYMCLGMANVFYALWTLDAATIERYGSKYIVVTAPIVLIISMKYSLDIERKDCDGDPVEVVLKDKALMIICVVYLLALFGVLYL